MAPSHMRQAKGCQGWIHKNSLTLRMPRRARGPANGEKLGTVSDRQDKEDFLLVHKGWLFGHDASIPRAAIERSDVNSVHLRVRKDELKGMNQTPLPEPTAPIRPITDAPEAATTDQPPAVPMTLGIPGPEVGMGAAAVAASAFSHDATSEPVSGNGSPVQSVGEAARDAAGHAVEAARQGVGQGVGQATDFVREQVGPIADQVKEQASAVAQQQMTSAAEGLESAAGAVTAVGDQLRESHLGALSPYTDLAAEQLEKAAAWLRTTTPEELARNVEDFAKKQPELFAAAAVALGLIGLRFLRGTGQDHSQNADDQNADEKKDDERKDDKQ
jgi:hypothetical protein